jgi:hypothetical protein
MPCPRALGVLNSLRDEDPPTGRVSFFSSHVYAYRAALVFFAVRDVFDLFRAIVPEHLRQKLETGVLLPP